MTEEEKISPIDASAMILGALPFVVFTVVQFVNPGYINELLIDPRGMVMAAAGVMSLLVGVFVLKKMVSFEI